MTKVPQRDEVRDKNLIADYQAVDEKGNYKFGIIELLAKYNMSNARLYQVLSHYKTKRRSSDVRQHANRKSGKNK